MPNQGFGSGSALFLEVDPDPDPHWSEKLRWWIRIRIKCKSLEAQNRELKAQNGGLEGLKTNIRRFPLL